MVFSEAGPLNQCSIEPLDLTLSDVYTRWMTRDAYSRALDPAAAPLNFNSDQHGRIQEVFKRKLGFIRGSFRP